MRGLTRRAGGARDALWTLDRVALCAERCEDAVVTEQAVHRLHCERRFVTVRASSASIIQSSCARITRLRILVELETAARHAILSSTE